jgi:GDP-D-mannose dehydratase
MKALIFGANGQDGYYLSEACRKRRIEVIGVSQSSPFQGEEKLLRQSGIGLKSGNN